MEGLLHGRGCSKHIVAFGSIRLCFVFKCALFQFRCQLALTSRVFVSDSCGSGALGSDLGHQFVLLCSVGSSFDEVVKLWHDLVVQFPRFIKYANCECWSGPSVS